MAGFLPFFIFPFSIFFVVIGDVDITDYFNFGFCRIAIPHTAMNKDIISVDINGGQVQAVNSDYQLYDDGNCRWIYFAYPEGTQEIQISAQQP